MRRILELFMFIIILLWFGFSCYNTGWREGYKESTDDIINLISKSIDMTCSDILTKTTTNNPAQEESK